jgi:hypothetical protein
MEGIRVYNKWLVDCSVGMWTRQRTSGSVKEGNFVSSVGLSVSINSDRIFSIFSLTSFSTKESQQLIGLERHYMNCDPSNNLQIAKYSVAVYPDRSSTSSWLHWNHELREFCDMWRMYQINTIPRTSDIPSVESSVYWNGNATTCNPKCDLFEVESLSNAELLRWQNISVHTETVQPVHW